MKRLKNPFIWLLEKLLKNGKVPLEIGASFLTNLLLFLSTELKYKFCSLHSFWDTLDGNKRIAAFLFLYFLEKNGLLFTENGNKRIADNALVALTLMIAVSKPEEKETMIKVIVNLINRNN